MLWNSLCWLWPCIVGLLSGCLWGSGLKAGLKGSPRITGDGGSFSSLMPAKAEGPRCGSCSKPKLQLHHTEHTSRKPQTIHHTKIHVDIGKNLCQCKNMEKVLTFLAWGGDWWTKAYWGIWGECIMSGEGLSRMCAVKI